MCGIILHVVNTYIHTYIYIYIYLLSVGGKFESDLFFLAIRATRSNVPDVCIVAIEKAATDDSSSIGVC